MRQSLAFLVPGAIGWAALLTVPALAGTDIGTGRLAALEPTTMAPSEINLAPYAVVELLKRKLAPGASKPEAAWYAELAGFYAGRDARTLWVDEHGLRPQAMVAMDELRRADDFGLEPSQFLVPDVPKGTTDPDRLAVAEVELSLAAVRYAWHARGGRIDPTELSLWLDMKPKAPNAADVMRSILAALDPASALRAMHPRHAQFEALRSAYLALRGGTSNAGSPQFQIPMGERIRPGRRHPDVALVRLRLGKLAKDGDNTLLDSNLQDALHAFMNGTAGIPYGRKRGVDDDVRRALNGGARAGNRQLMDLLRANMERWRWLPHDFGELYVWNNLPEFETRVIKNGHVLHKERIIIGQPSTQTPVFSDSMVRVIFNPDWNVPESIKLAQIWPNLRGGDYGVLKRRNMRIIHEGKEINPAKLKYAELNARDVPVVMGPGPSNPLGRFKFMFPNKHDVYMHDTTSKGLFASSERTFSHGCIRVKDPQRFAEVILAEAKSWNKADVAWQTRAKTTVRVELDRHVPIHNTYFTLVAGPSGELKKFSDVYGHDKRMIDAMAGVDLKKIAASDPARALKKRNEDLASGALVLPPQKKKTAAKARPRVAAPARYYGYYGSYPPPRQSFFNGRSGLTRAYRAPSARGIFQIW